MKTFIITTVGFSISLFWFGFFGYIISNEDILPLTKYVSLANGCLGCSLIYYARD